MRVAKKQAKQKHSWKNVFLSPEMNLFFSECFFYLLKLTVFLGIINNPMRALGRKKTHVFFGNGRPKSIARAHLKQRKKS